jgi:hypothetical protein
MQKVFAHIIPPDTSAELTLTQGTRIVVGDAELAGVTRVVLYADVNNVWRAEIHCLCAPPNVCAEAVVTVAKPLSWWRWLCLRLSGVTVVQTTSLQSTYEEFRSLIGMPPTPPPKRVMRDGLGGLMEVKPQQNGTVEKDACD